MKNSTINCLLLISSCLLCLAACRTSNDATAARQLFDAGGEASRYRVVLAVDGEARMTGVLAVKFSDGEWRGSIVNEFGIKAFDFTVNDRKCRLLNVAPFLDKWYIRRTVADDLGYLFWGVSHGEIVKNKQLSEADDGSFVLKNLKRGIEYKFRTFER